MRNGRKKFEFFFRILITAQSKGKEKGRERKKRKKELDPKLLFSRPVDRLAEIIVE